MQASKETTRVGNSKDGKDATVEDGRRKKRPLRSLVFRYATMQDMAMMLIGTIAATMSG